LSTQEGNIKKRLLLKLQQFWLTFEFFGKNGLANHAAAGAYGFLLSAAPVLLVIAFFVFNIFANSPEVMTVILRRIHRVSRFFNAGDFVRDFLSTANPGLVGIISVLPIFWAARFCAQSMQRGLGVIFPEIKTGEPAPRSFLGPFRATAVTLGLGFLIILFIFIMLFGSRIALEFFSSMDFALARVLYAIIRIIPFRVLFLFWLFLLIIISYRFVPLKRPEWKHIIPGGLFCIIFFLLITVILSLLVNPSKYNLLYGALGRLFLFLLIVYFFFYFYFYGAQFIMVLATSEALLFIWFRRYHSSFDKNKTKPWNKLFANLPWLLQKYTKEFKKGDLVFTRGSLCQEVYFILSGKAGAYLDNECQNRLGLIDEMSFFGEMEYLVSEGRSASIKAETDLLAILLPRQLYRKILQIDPDTDRSIIQGMSERLKSVYEHGLP
jgi:membrane protein